MKLNRWNSYDEHGRICTNCKVYLPWDSFHKHAQCPYGRNTVCKACRVPKSSRSYSIRSLEQRLLDGARSRANKKGLDFNLTVSDIIIPTKCPVLGIAMKAGTVYAPSIDRTDSSKGYTKDNIVIMSRRANILKNNATAEEVRAVLAYIEGVCELV